MARQVSAVKRGDVYTVNFDPTRGSETRKSRPAVVIQNDIDNQYSPVTVVAPITSQFDIKLYPTEVLVTAPEGGLRIDSVILLNQLRAIDKSRLGKRLGSLKPATMALVNDGLEIVLALIEI